MSIFHILLFICSFSNVSLNNFNYDDQGSWGGQCTSSEEQSPVILITKSATKTKIPSIMFNNYNTPCKIAIENSHLTVNVFVVGGCATPYISSGGLPDEYMLHSIHFHWDAEHVIDGTRHPLEAHLVHFAKKYGRIESAKMQKEGIAVVSVIYEVSPKQNKAFNGIIKSMPEINRFVGYTAKVDEPIELQDLLPLERAFYRYRGSLTTPDCNPVVIWTIYEKPSYISKMQTVNPNLDRRIQTHYEKLQVFAKSE